MNESYLKFSVVTVSYNQGKYIEDNIKSILSQDYPNFEHIIMDGGSTDNTVEILSKYPHLTWQSEKDRGQTHALNKALAIATGDIICWLNSDDMLCESAFKTVNNFFIKNREAAAVVGNLLYIDENKNLLSHKKAASVDYNGLLNQGQCVQQPSTFFRKVVYDRVGFLDETFHFTMDHEFWLRVTRNYKIHTIDKDLARFRVHKESKTGSRTLGFIKETIRLKRKYNARVLSVHNFKLLFMFIKEPFKKIQPLRRLVRRLKGVNPDHF